MSENKTTTVYLMVECEVIGFNSPRFGDKAEMARNIVENAINKDSGNFISANQFAFTWPKGQVLVGVPAIMDDQVVDAYEREKERS